MFHHHWTYRGHGVKNSLFNLLIQFHLTSWVAIVGTAAIVSILVTYFRFHYIFALVIGGMIALVWNFLWSKFVIWRDKTHPGD
jgi:putative flippase GtrA